MAFSHNPNIVTEGLVLSLDAADKISFSSGSTTWTDLSRNSNNGTLSAGTMGTVSGSNTIAFNGSSDYISIADADNLSFGDGSTDSAFTISAWVKMDDATYFMIASKGKAFDGDAEYSFFVGGGDNLSLEIFDESVDAYEKAVCNSTLTAYEGQWVHLVVTYDGRGGSSANAGITFYVNGSSQAVTLSDANTYVAMENHGGDVRVGRWHTVYAEGSMANVGIWDRVLTAEEVSQNFNAQRSRFGI